MKSVTKMSKNLNDIVSGGDFPTKDPTCGYKSLGEYCQNKLEEHADRILLVFIFIEIKLFKNI